MDLFLKLIDKIIELLKVREGRKVQAFKEIVEPLFNDMSLVVSDYFSFFGVVANRLAAEPAATDLEEVLQSLRERRQQLLHIRIKVRAMADALSSDVKDENVVRFAEAIARFFCPEPLHFFGRSRSASATFVDLVEALEFSDNNGELTQRELFRLCQYVQSDLERSWVEATKRYAVLRIAYLTSSNVQRKGRTV